ncbi:MAG: hypothetical protein M0Z60_03440 [Nitrospiraceae bacterium]|nr:hypothetical protein [Nitrospiraceae bacterium]
MSKSEKYLPGILYTLSNGKAMTIFPVPFGKMNILSEAVARLFVRIREAGLELTSLSDLRQLFDIAFEEIVAIMGLILDKPREWFDTIDLGDGMALLDLIAEQNFNDRTKRNLSAVMVRLGALTPGSSSPSPSPAGLDGKSHGEAEPRARTSQQSGK